MDALDRAIRRLKFATIALAVALAFYVGVVVYLLATGRRVGAL